MKRNFAFAFIVTALICSKRAGAQMFADSVRKEWKVYEQSSKNDTARFILYSKLSNSYRRNNYDSCLYYARFALEIAKKLKSRKAEASALAYLEFGLRETGDFVGALNTQFQGLQLARETGDEDLEANELNSIGNTYLELGDAAKAIGTSATVTLTPAAIPTGTGTKVLFLTLEYFQEVNGVQYSLKNGSYNSLAIIEVV